MRECHETVSCCDRVLFVCRTWTHAGQPYSRWQWRELRPSAVPTRCSDTTGTQLPVSWRKSHMVMCRLWMPAVTVIDLPVEMLIINMISTGVISNQCSK